MIPNEIRLPLCGEEFALSWGGKLERCILRLKQGELMLIQFKHPASLEIMETEKSLRERGFVLVEQPSTQSECDLKIIPRNQTTDWFPALLAFNAIIIFLLIYISVHLK